MNLPTTQERIIETIISEREKQQAIIPDDDRKKPPSHWVGILMIWLGKAASETPLNRGRTFSPSMFKRRLIQISAICLAALEALDDFE